MKRSESSYHAQTSVAVFLLGVLGTMLVIGSGSTAPADEHAVLVDSGQAAAVAAE